MTWKRWLGSLLNAGISGSIIALAGGLAGLTGHQIWIMALTSFMVSAGKWYLLHPPPGVESDVEQPKDHVEP